MLPAEAGRAGSNGLLGSGSSLLHARLATRKLVLCGSGPLLNSAASSETFRDNSSRVPGSAGGFGEWRVEGVGFEG